MKFSSTTILFTEAGKKLEILQVLKIHLLIIVEVFIAFEVNFTPKGNKNSCIVSH